MNTVKADIMDKILDKLSDYVSTGVKLEDNPYTVSYTLWEVESANGTCTYDKQEAIAWIQENFEDLADVMEDYERDYEPLNPFSNPEVFMVKVSIYVTYCLVDAVWKNKMTAKQLFNALKKLQKDLGWK